MSGMTAWATVPGNNIGADPGITVTTYSGDGGVTQEHDLPASELDRDFLLDAYSKFNARHADELLARAGYERSGEWQESGGQWGADVDLAELVELSVACQTERHQQCGGCRACNCHFEPDGDPRPAGAPARRTRFSETN